MSGARTPFVAGNWKMNMTIREAVAFVEEIRAPLGDIDGIDVAFCAPAITLPTMAAALAGSPVGVGAQNMHWERSGAYTGELSAPMIAPYCDYVILGHSERRQYFAETDEGVNKKIKAALAHGIVPIVCVGESLAQNEAGETNAIVSAQVRAAFAGVAADDVPTCVIAYEPIWAIGTGKSASADVAGNIIKTAVRDTVADMFGSDAAQALRIQYGGSCKPHNIADYMAHPDIDGGLIGGASLKSSFVELVKNAL